MAFISIDIAYTEGYKYLLIMGDIFSKYFEAVPTKDQQAQTIVNALWKSWITRHGCPRYILSDQAGNVDGASIRDVCTNFGIEKRRTSSYYSQGNGFAERNIRSIREIMRTLLLDQKLPQSYWRNILPTVVFFDQHHRVSGYEMHPLRSNIWEISNTTERYSVRDSAT